MFHVGFFLWWRGRLALFVIVLLANFFLGGKVESLGGGGEDGELALHICAKMLYMHWSS